MKKIFLLMTIMTSLFFALSIDSNASSYQGITLDTPISQLFSYTLREVFEDFNVVPNSRFDNDDILLYDSFNTNIFSIEDGVLYGQGDNITTRAFVMLDVLTIGETYYLRYDIETSIIGNSSTRLYSGSLSTPFISGVTSYNSYSVKGIADTYRLFVSDWRYDTLNQDDEILKVDNVFAIQLDSDLASLNISILDYYYNLYTALYYNLNIDLFYNEGENDGYDEGYDTGYDSGLIIGEGIGYDNGYSDGQEDGYDTGYLDGNVAGLETGYLNGYNDGFDEGVVSEVDTQWLLGFVTGTINVLGVSIIPGISLGVFVFIPLFLGFIGFIFRLGGRRG